MLQTISKFEVIVSVFVNQLFQTIVFLRLLLNKPRNTLFQKKVYLDFASETYSFYWEPKLIEPNKCLL